MWAGLSVHLNQVHKEQLNEVENALPERKTLGVEIFGMEGIPEDVKQRHDKRVAEEYWEEQASRRQATGNPPTGSKEALAAKPSKFGDDDDLIKRFKEHMARVQNGEAPPSAVMEGVQPAPGVVGSESLDSYIFRPLMLSKPPSISPDQAQPYAAPPFQPPLAPPLAPPFQPPLAPPLTPPLSAPLAPPLTPPLQPPLAPPL